LPFLEKNFYDTITDLNPDNGAHLLVCLGGDFSASGESNLPFRGADSSYANRWCSKGASITNEQGEVIGVEATTSDELCDHYTEEERAQIPHMNKNVKASLDFLGKASEGFFLMYEQGDVSFCWL
jgi:hypothetical protein